MQNASLLHSSIKALYLEQRALLCKVEVQPVMLQLKAALLLQSCRVSSGSVAHQRPIHSTPVCGENCKFQWLPVHHPLSLCANVCAMGAVPHAVTHLVSFVV